MAHLIHLCELFKHLLAQEGCLFTSVQGLEVSVPALDASFLLLLRRLRGQQTLELRLESSFRHHFLTSLHPFPSHSRSFKVMSSINFIIFQYFSSSFIIDALPFAFIFFFASSLFASGQSCRSSRRSLSTSDALRAISCRCFCSSESLSERVLVMAEAMSSSRSEGLKKLQICSKACRS